jgi:hypothetical protein
MAFLLSRKAHNLAFLLSRTVQALALRTAGIDTVAVLSPSALLLWAASRWINVNALGASLEVSSGCRACEGEHEGQSGVFVACSTGVAFLLCDWSTAAPTSCSSLQLISLPLRPIVAAVASGTSLFLAPSTGGLLLIELSPSHSPTPTAPPPLPPRLSLQPACNPHPGLPPHGDLKALSSYGPPPRYHPATRNNFPIISSFSAIYRCRRSRQLHCHLPNDSPAAHHRAAAGARAHWRQRYGRRQRHNPLSHQARQHLFLPTVHLYIYSTATAVVSGAWNGLAVL